ncbi:unnamed protein product [Sphagnum jensenii]|uniref:Uncharacterized protein n=1 Tax=Sphagnum jensenii TaxID=128206 RepID=A0ABP1A789_9BRYO
MPIEVAPTSNVPSPKIAIEGTGVSQETTIKSKILSHFIKGKISLSPMETVLMIPRELEHLESLVKLVRRKKDAKTMADQNVSSEAMERNGAVTLESASSGTLKVDLEKMSLCDPVATEQTNVPVSDSDTDADDDNDGGLQSVESIDDKFEFGNTELEELVLKEGPQQILQLTL